MHLMSARLPGLAMPSALEDRSLAAYFENVRVRVPRADVDHALLRFEERAREMLEYTEPGLREDLASIGLGGQADELVIGLLDRRRVVPALHAIGSAFAAAVTQFYARQGPTIPGFVDGHGVPHGDPPFARVQKRASNMVTLGIDLRTIAMLRRELSRIETPGSDAASIELDVPAATMLLGDDQA